MASRTGRHASKNAEAQTTPAPANAKTMGKMQQRLAASAANKDAPIKVFSFISVSEQRFGQNPFDSPSEPERPASTPSQESGSYPALGHNGRDVYQYPKAQESSRS